MKESPNSENCNKCGEYLVPNVYHDCKVIIISELTQESLQQMINEMMKIYENQNNKSKNS